MKLSFFKGNRVVKNAGWLVSGSIVQKLLGFLIGIWTARYLGPSNYGLINYASAYTTFFFSLSTLGLNNIIVKSLVDKPSQEGTTLGTTLVLQLIASAFSVVTIVLFVSFVDAGETETIVVTLLCSLGLLFQMLDSIKYWFQAKLESRYAVIATTAAYVLTSLYKVILLMNGKDVRWFAIASSIDYVVVAIILFATYRRKQGPKLRFSKATAKRLVKSSYHYILSGLMISIYGATDKLMLKQLLDESAVGYYGTAVSVSNVWVFVLAALIDSLNPVIMEAHNKERTLYEKKNRQLYAIVLYCSIIVSVFMVLFAKIGVQLLYGNEYLPAVQPLQIITWYVAFSYLGVARNAWMVCENKQKYLTPLYIGAAITNVILNALLIPSMGAEGAALASLVTQISTILVFPALIKELRPNVKMMVDAALLRNIR